MRSVSASNVGAAAPTALTASTASPCPARHSTAGTMSRVVSKSRHSCPADWPSWKGSSTITAGSSGACPAASSGSALDSVAVTTPVSAGCLQSCVLSAQPVPASSRSPSLLRKSIRRPAGAVASQSVATEPLPDRRAGIDAGSTRASTRTSPRRATGPELQRSCSRLRSASRASTYANWPCRRSAHTVGVSRARIGIGRSYVARRGAHRVPFKSI